MHASPLGEPLALRCGATVPNRIAKAAMTEGLAHPRTNEPNERHLALYSRWSAGGLGMCITGNVMVDRRYLENPRNIVIDERTGQLALARFAEACRSGGAMAVVQLSHPGRQCPMSVTLRPVAPSAIKVRIKNAPPLFMTPRAMSGDEIRAAVAQFALSARRCAEAGFDGVQIHAAHGYLLSQFLSPAANARADEWGGSAPNRRRLLLEVLRAVREATRAFPRFAVGVKLNSADFQQGGFSEDESLEVLRALEREADGVDFVEISGGTYENAEMMKNAPRESTREREAYFMDFVRKARRVVTRTPLMLSGGWRTRAAMEDAVRSGLVDLIGIARPVCMEPELPRRLITGEADGAMRYELTLGAAFFDASFVPALNNFYHQRQIARIADGLHPDPRMGYAYALTVMLLRTYLWDPRRSHPVVRYGVFVGLASLAYAAARLLRALGG